MASTSSYPGKPWEGEPTHRDPSGALIFPSVEDPSTLVALDDSYWSGVYLTRARDVKLAEAKAKQNSVKFAGITFNGIPVRTDSEFRGLVADEVLIYQLFKGRNAGNSYRKDLEDATGQLRVGITGPNMEGLLEAIVNHWNAADTRYRTLRTYILDPARTYADLTAYSVNAGWPATL
jgi:hypothetical protein